MKNLLELLASLPYDEKADIVCAFTDWLGLDENLATGVEIALLEFVEVPTVINNVCYAENDFAYYGDIEFLISEMKKHPNVIANTPK